MTAMDAKLSSMEGKLSSMLLFNLFIDPR